MAIKIDLLPGYVALRRWFKRLLSACVILVGTIGFVLFVETVKDQQMVSVMKANVDAVEIVAEKTEASESAAATARTEVAPQQAVIDFITHAGQTGASRASVVDSIRQYIMGNNEDGVVLTSMDLSDGVTVKLALTVKTPDQYGAFLTNLRKGANSDPPVFDGLPSANGIPGFPPPEVPVPTPSSTTPGGNSPTPLVFPLKINAVGKLKNPITVPPEPTGGTSVIGAAVAASTAALGPPPP